MAFGWPPEQRDEFAASNERCRLTLQPKGLYKDSTVPQGKRDASPLISRYLCIIECSCEPVCLLSCRRTTLMRQETREVVGVFWAAGAAKKWSRWASG